MMSDCLFCALSIDRIISESEHWYYTDDLYPVTPGHGLFISKRHVSDFFDLTAEEQADLWSFVKTVRNSMRTRTGVVSGFNVGINIGIDAGQTVPHCHVHLIPRRKGDVKNPRGGVRNIFPGKGDYQEQNNS